MNARNKNGMVRLDRRAPGIAWIEAASIRRFHSRTRISHRFGICCLPSLRALIDAKNHTKISWALQDLVDLHDFHADVVDVILLAIARPIVLGLLCWCAIALGTPKLDDLVRQRPCAGSVHVSGGGAGAPLLVNAAPAGVDAAAGTGAACSSRNAAAANLVLSTDVKEEHLASQKRQERAEFRKNVVCALMFMFTSGVQVFVGIKCIGFDCNWAQRPTLPLGPDHHLPQLARHDQLRVFPCEAFRNALHQGGGLSDP